MVGVMIPSNNSESIDFLKTLSVLYVEDEKNIRDGLAVFMGRRFAQVDTAADGKEGLDKFKATNHDIVITDVRMPIMDGLEMARRIKEISMDVPIIVVTAYNETDYFMRAIEIGIDRYVKKPVNTHELIDAIYKSTLVHYHRLALERERKHVTDLLEQTVGTLARAIEKRDPYTDGHQKRVAHLAVAIAEEMALPDSSIDGIRLAAMIHDVGKITIPAELLSRPGTLTDLEFELIKQHPRSGFEILGDIKFPWPIAEIILQHHEKMDGSGYPRGLKGDEILLEAYILGVADTVEAMASHRPYRASLGLETAIAEIKEKRDTQFPADVVDACMRVINENPEIINQA